MVNVFSIGDVHVTEEPQHKAQTGIPHIEEEAQVG